MMHAAVIGNPVGHSLSPSIHGFWIAQLGLNAAYRADTVTADGLDAYLAGKAADPDWRGVNVTMPLKEAVLAHVGDPGAIRAGIGAMNTIVRDGSGALIGTNTDPAGFIEPLLARGWQDSHAIVAGTGGCARAVLFALRQVGVTHLSLAARNPLKAMGLLAQFGFKGSVLALDAPLPPASLVVNASALGMTGQDAWTPALDALPADAIVYDAVYAPVDTPLLKAAMARGLETVEGLEMLVGQAALAFELFFGTAAPRDADEALWELLTARL